MIKEKDYTTSITVDRSASEVFEALNNVSEWWQGEIHGNTKEVGDEFTYQMKEFHYTKQRIIESVPEKKVVWLVIESKINFVTDKEEWLHTKIVFDIDKTDDETKITFTHQGLVPTIECYDGCSGAWEGLIEKSLFSYITTGKGVDIF